MKRSVRYGQDAIREEIAELEEKRRSLEAAEFSPEYMWRQSHEEQSRIRKEKRVALRKLDEQIETLKTYLQDPDSLIVSSRGVVEMSDGSQLDIASEKVYHGKVE